MEDMRGLLERAHQGDKAARDRLVEKNTGLVWSIVRRFLNRGVEAEDLFQIGSIGLLKAIDKFDTGYAVRFSTYAVPMISGEIKRFLRDDGLLKVSRTLKELAAKGYAVREKLEKRLGREPTLTEISEELAVEPEELSMALESGAEIESLQKTIYQGEGNEIPLMDKIQEKRDDGEQLLNRILLEELLTDLPAKERQLLYLRYFQEETQAVIAGRLGISQVQVSRMEKKILQKLKRQAENQGLGRIVF